MFDKTSSKIPKEIEDVWKQSLYKVELNKIWRIMTIITYLYLYWWKNQIYKLYHINIITSINYVESLIISSTKLEEYEL